MGFEWDESKNLDNTSKHGLSFYMAQEAFFDTKILLDKNIQIKKNGISVLVKLPKAA